MSLHCLMYKFINSLVLQLGSKKAGGLGAQRVKANFADIEREAELADQLRTQESVNTPQPEKTPEEQEAQVIILLFQIICRNEQNWKLNMFCVVIDCLLYTSRCV